MNLSLLRWSLNYNGASIHHIHQYNNGAFMHLSLLRWSLNYNGASIQYNVMVHLCIYLFYAGVWIITVHQYNTIMVHLCIYLFYPGAWIIMVHQYNTIMVHLCIYLFYAGVWIIVVHQIHCSTSLYFVTRLYSTWQSTSIYCIGSTSGNSTTIYMVLYYDIWSNRQTNIWGQATESFLFMSHRVNLCCDITWYHHVPVCYTVLVAWLSNTGNSIWGKATEPPCKATEPPCHVK
jgi:hypothetical protein